MKALVLDLEEDILDLLDYNLTKAGFEVLGLEEEDDMLAIATTYQPHVVLIGNCSSLEKQRELCHNVRQLDSPVDPLIICLTTDQLHCDAGGNCDVGADLCIVTPIPPRQLIAEIELHMEHLMLNTV